MLQKRCDFQQTKIDKEMAMIKEKLKKKDKKGAMSHCELPPPPLRSPSLMQHNSAQSLAAEADAI